MGFILNLVDLAMQKLHLLLLLLNLTKSAALHFMYNSTVYLNNLIIFIISRVEKASAADTVDLNSITGLVKPNLEKVCIHIQLSG